MKKAIKLLGLFLVLLFLSTSAIAGQPKYVFYIIGDGMGAPQRQVAQDFLRAKTNNPSKELLMNSFDVAGLNTTYSANSLITDSAAAGTALACGVKTNSGVIGMDIKGRAVKSLITAAGEHGMATGVITTTRLTHATPASFVAHNISRNNPNEIAEDLLVSNVDFFAGGGIRHFIPKSMRIENGDAKGKTIKSKRKDERNLIKEFEEKGYATFIGMKGAIDFSKQNFSKLDSDKVFASFTYSHMPYELERINQYDKVPSLAEMTRAGIDFLKKDEDGFFIMIEGGRIDHAAHLNDPPAMIYDTIALDNAVQEAYEFYNQHPEETLIVVLADHETGGLGLGMDSMGYKLNLEALFDAKISVEDTLLYGSGKYNGDKAAYLSLIENKLGLTNLTEQESAKLQKAMEEADAGKTVGYYKYDPPSLAVAHILSNRANISWTSTIHSASMVPLSAIGVEALRFSGFKDNTEIYDTMATLMDF